MKQVRNKTYSSQINTLNAYLSGHGYLQISQLPMVQAEWDAWRQGQWGLRNIKCSCVVYPLMGLNAA